ncbi:glutathione S-transferase family protein [Streptococcus oricebi]|uniref:Glutathione S-transferase n=1 Tax=Streptococcus oricebi TaxID=1547447 RepID=A0ABS5B0Q0_9STRE|nr:glutathione S-transferase N-terminal domain-containing protein [Streptococcus oricebi]MBP2622402.1 glutathione S-transferase [Streptococcus oricebi]
MKLYYAPGTCALACWIAFEWAGADYEVEKVNYASEEYQKINPLGLVPALNIGGPRAMTQADAILQFIAASYPEADLAANPGLENQFEFNETMAFLTGDFHPAFWPMFVPARYTSLKTASALEAAQEASYPRIDKVMEHLDSLIGDSRHVYQNKRTVADAYAFVMALWSVKTPKSWKEYPHLAPFMEEMKKDPAVQKVLSLSKQ